MKKLALLVLLFAALLLPLSACAAKERVLTSDEQTPILEYAEPIAENIFGALKSGSYTDFTKDMDEAMIKAMSETSFNDLRTKLDTKVGAYVSRSVKSVSEVGDYYAVIYAVVYENAPEVTYRLVLTKSEPHLVSGLWMNSPELAK